MAVYIALNHLMYVVSLISFLIFDRARVQSMKTINNAIKVSGKRRIKQNDALKNLATFGGTIMPIIHQMNINTPVQLESLNLNFPC